VLRNMASTKLAAIQADAKAERAYNPANDNAGTLDSASIALLVVGGAAVVTGAVLYLANRGNDAPAPATAASVDRSSLASRLSVAWTPDQGVRLGYAATF
jgi:hypothetical protein